MTAPLACVGCAVGSPGFYAFAAAVGGGPAVWWGLRRARRGVPAFGVPGVSAARLASLAALLAWLVPLWVAGERERGPAVGGRGDGRGRRLPGLPVVAGVLAAGRPRGA